MQDSIPEENEPRTAPIIVQITVLIDKPETSEKRVVQLTERMPSHCRPRYSAKRPTSLRQHLALRLRRKRNHEQADDEHNRRQRDRHPERMHMQHRRAEQKVHPCADKTPE